MRHLRLLGPVSVTNIQAAHTEVQGKVVAPVPRFRSRRTVGLLGYLAVEGRPLSRDLLAALFWPDEAPTKGRANLSRELHNLAKILPHCWEQNRQSVAFIPAADTSVDLYQLRHLELDKRWEEAAGLLGGEFLEGLVLDHNHDFENWLLGERERWRGRAEKILRYVIEGHAQRGRYSDGLREARRLLQWAPWDEATHRQIMRFLAWTGQRGAALRQFEGCQRALREELDVDPDRETIALYQQIQAGTLALPPQHPAFLSEEKARRAFERPPFVGREQELDRLNAYLNGALVGQGRVVFITGGPGQGKTALLDAFGRRAMAMHSDLLVAGGRCSAYSGQGDPYLPYREVMAMLTGDVEGRWDAGTISRDHARRLWVAFPLVLQAILDYGPQLLDVFVPAGALLSRATAAGEVYAPSLTRLRQLIQRQAAGREEVEQSQLFQQLTDVLSISAQEKPLLLLLDDIQWADVASIAFLFHLGRYMANGNSRLLVACAYRPEEVALGRLGERHPLAKVLAEFKRTFGDVWLNLGLAGKQESRRFMHALLDVEPNRLGEGFRDALFHRTGGHPLFTVELLGAMRERGELRQDADGAWIEGATLDWEVLPARVEAVIQERVDQLDSNLQDILATASVEGELFTAQVLAEVMRVPERSLLRRLSGDLERRHGLIREQEEIFTGQKRLSRYQFSHIVFQDYLYQRLSRGEQRLLHGEVAKALEALYEGRLNEMAVQLAHHYYQSGDYQQAFYYNTVSGERAARLFESREAITHYTRAIKLADDIHIDVDSLVKLYRKRGLAYETIGEFEQARADYKVILQIARADSKRRAEWRALLDIGKLWRSRDYDQAHGCFKSALELAQQSGDPALLAESLNWMGNWYANDDKPQKAVEYHQRALSILEDLGDRQDVAITLDLLGIASLLGGDLYASLRYYNRSILLYRESGDHLRLVSSLIGRATIVSVQLNLVPVPVIPPPDALMDFEEALRIAGEVVSASDQAWAYWSLGMFHTVRGHFGPALEDIQNSLRIASDIAHREYIVGARAVLGRIYVELFAAEKAREQLEAALTLAEDLHSQTWRYLIVGSLAGLYLTMNQPEQAQICLEQVSLSEMDPGAKSYCWLRWAELALAMDDPAFALDIIDRLITSAPGMSTGRVITYLWKLKAEALVAVDPTDEARVEAARCLLLAAIETAQASGERFLLWRLQASIGRLHCTLGDQEVAEKAFSVARASIDELATTISDKTLRDVFRQGAYSLL